MAKQSFKLPLQVLPPYYQDDDGTAFVYLLNPSGGILQYDKLHTELVLEKDSKAYVTTPSANKFYRMDESHAEIVNNIELMEGAELEYMPHYSIPFSESSVIQETIIKMDGNSTLITADMILPGRIESGEYFQYHKYQSKIKIYVDDILEVYEYANLKPKEKELEGIGVLGNRLIYATAYLCKKDIPEELREEFVSYFEENSQVDGGVSLVTPHILTVRMLGDSVQSTQDAVDYVWEKGRNYLLGKEKVRIRK